MNGDLTLGFYKDGKFDVFAKIRNPQGEHSALAIYSPQDEQDVRNCINVLVAQGLLRFENDHYIVTPKGKHSRNQLHQSFLQIPQERREQP